MANGKVVVVEEWSLKEWESGRELKERLLSAVQPLVFRKCLGDAWPAVVSHWSPAGLGRLLGERETTFKVCPRRDSPEYRRRFRETETVFETHCLHVRATFLDFAEWFEFTAADFETSQQAKKSKLEDSSTPETSSNPLLTYPPSHYWIYADYKYMTQLCDDLPELLQAIDWSPFGFEGRGGADSTLWAGSQEAYTPCHYDTYGCNLVAEVWGRKKWTLHPPSESAQLYPTRTPYEESSVFSQVNVVCPDLERHPDFASATSYQVVLEAGDVLFVPTKWWHYVECLENAVSVNTWIPLPSDARERVKEAVVRATVAGWLQVEDTASSTGSSSGSDCDSELLVNPNEEIFSHQKNLELLSVMLAECQALPTEEPHPPLPTISHQDWVDVLTSERVVEAVTTTLLERHKLQHTS